MTISASKLHMRGISIEFPGVKALSDVSFEAETGRIHALVGANGAGKSTLMKVLSGVYEHYQGQIYMDDKEVQIRTPRDAKRLGIETVYQEVDTALIPHLDVAENIMLDVMVNGMKNKIMVDWKYMHLLAKQTLKRLGIEINTHRLVHNLSLAEKQMVLIARAIVEEKKFLILDEPTAPLSKKETEELFRVVRDLAMHHKVGIVFISHRITELFEICEDITVMRDGKVVINSPLKELTTKQVVEYMLGRKFNQNYVKERISIGEPLFWVKGLTDKEEKVKDIELAIRAGEIVGIAGLVGAGKTELCKAIFGASPLGTGEVWIKGKKVRINTPYDAVRKGLALVPEERRKEGVLVEEPIFSNLSVASLSRYSTSMGFLKTMKEKVAAKKMIGELGIKTPNENQKVAYLSGGNQQKVAVGKWLMAEVGVYIFDEPTKGVDVGAKQDIFHLIGLLAQKGNAILYATSELSELMIISDRIYVMFDGVIVKEVVTSETTEEEILYYATGGV